MDGQQQQNIGPIVDLAQNVNINNNLVQGQIDNQIEINVVGEQILVAEQNLGVNQNIIDDNIVAEQNLGVN